jgi:hypothetical protein
MQRRKAAGYMGDGVPAFLQRTAISRGGNRQQVSGTAIFTPEPGAPDEQAQTRQCVHCGMQFIVVPGSGRSRGYCMSCDGITCGAKVKCETECTHFEKAIEQMEAEARHIDLRGAVLL